MKFRQGFIPLLDRTIDDPAAGRLCQRTANPVGRPLLNFSSPRLGNQRPDESARRSALANSGGRTIIQGDLHIYTDSGEVIFESAGLYGADCRTRQNLPRASRLHILALETRLPASLLVLGIIRLTRTVWQAIRAKAARGRQVGDPPSLQGLKDEEEA